MIRRLLPLAGVLYALTAGAHTAAATDITADCWWHISHWHCGNEIVWAPGPGETTTTTPTDTTTTTSSTSSTSTTEPPATTTSDVQPLASTTIATTSTTIQPIKQTSTTQPPPETTQAPPSSLNQDTTTSITSTSQIPATSIDKPTITSSTSASSSLPPYVSTTGTIQTTTTIVADSAPAPATTVPDVTTLNADTADAYFEQLDIEQLTAEQAAELVAQVQNAPVEIRQAFERNVNIFGGAAENYVPLGSLVPVRARRVIIITVSALVALPRKRP